MIFISYRNGDVGSLVGNLDESLVMAFNRDAVFRDKRRLKGGQNWRSELEKKASTCQVMLVIIGPNWDMIEKHLKGKFYNQSKLDNPEDWVRKEVSYALNNPNCLVIPLLINNVEEPNEDYLKRFGLGGLIEKHNHRLRDDTYENDLKALIGVIKDNLREDPGKIEKEFKILEYAYLKWIIRCHGLIEFRGINYSSGGTVSVPLNQVYLALQADTTDPIERAAVRQEIAEKIRMVILNEEISQQELEHLEWQCIAGNPIMPSLELRDRMFEMAPDLKKTINLGEAYYNSPHSVILGDPGSGKTTLAKWLSVVSAQALLDNSETLIVPLHQVDPDVEDRDSKISLGISRVPILIRIGEYAEYRSKSDDLSILGFLGHQSWQGSYPVWPSGEKSEGRRIDPTLLNRWFHHVLKQGRALVILDGLDEVADSNLRDLIAENVDSFIAYWIEKKHPEDSDGVPDIFLDQSADKLGNRLIVTSRIAGYQLSRLKRNLTHLTIDPMSNYAVEKFIGNWMQAVHLALDSKGRDREEIHGEAVKEADLFIKALHQDRNRGGRGLATNPLLCGILATIFMRNKGQLPQERVELYGQAVDMLVSIWLDRQGNIEKNKVIKHELFDILEPLAEHIHRHEPTGLIPHKELQNLAERFLANSRGENPLKPSAATRSAVEEMIRIVQKDVGILAARGEKVYGFLHLTFQEYFASRALVRDVNAIHSRILDHMEDARWREVIFLGLGYLSEQDPKALPEIVRQILQQDTSLKDILPQAVLMLVESLKDLRGSQPEIARAVVNQLISSYTDNKLHQKLPRRRELFTWAFHSLIESGYEEELEREIIIALNEANADEVRASAAAEIAHQMELSSMEVVKALQNASNYDSSEWAWPIQRTLRMMYTKSDGQVNSSDSKNSHFNPTAWMNKKSSKLISQDFDWLSICIALFGGLGDYNVVEGIKTYYEIAAFLQQGDNARERYRHAFIGKWADGHYEGDFIYNMAVFLDTHGKSLLSRLKNEPVFDPEMMFGRSELEIQLSEAIEEGYSPRDFLNEYGNFSIGSSSDFSLIQWVVNPNAQDKHLHHSILKRVRRNLADVVSRIGPMVPELMEGLLSGLAEEQVLPVIEAVANTTLSNGTTPFASALLKLKDLLPDYVKKHLLAEELSVYSQGWGDDGVYNTAAFLDRNQFVPDELLKAHSVLAIAAHLQTFYTMWEWPYAYLPPAELSARDIPPAILDNLLFVPKELGFVRQWSLDTVLKPVIDSNPLLIPEVLAFALGDTVARGSRQSVFQAYGPELLDHPNPGQAILQKIEELTDPYYQCRALLRLSRYLPEERSRLLELAQKLVEKIVDPIQKIRVIEFQWMEDNSPVGLSTWNEILSCIESIVDMDERARAFARLGLHAPKEIRQEYFINALNAIKSIIDERDRSTTARLISKSIALKDFEKQWKEVLESFENTLLRARACEDWGQVFGEIASVIKSETKHQVHWAVLSLSARIDSEIGNEQKRMDLLWSQITENHRIEVVDEVQILSPVKIIQLTPKVLLSLRILEENGRQDILESIFPRLRLSSREAIPFLNQQLRSSNNVISSTSALMLSEKFGLSDLYIPGLLQCLRSPNDLTRHRASEIMYGNNSKDPQFHTSMIGQQGLNVLFESLMDKFTPYSVRQAIFWFKGGVVYDSDQQIQHWADQLRKNPKSSSFFALRGVHHFSNSAFQQLLNEFRNGGGKVRQSIFISLANLAYHDRLPMTETLPEVLQNISDPLLDQFDSCVFTLKELSTWVVEYLNQNQYETEGLNQVIDVKDEFVRRYFFSWSSVCELETTTEIKERLKKIGKMLYTTSSVESTRWSHAASAAQAGLEVPGYVELLCDWLSLALSEDINDPGHTINFERSYLLELLAGAASLAPVRYQQHAEKIGLQSRLIEVVIHNKTFVSRSDGIRLLGYQRKLTSEMLPAIHSALMDVEHVRVAAIESMNHFRQLDHQVFDQLVKWLKDESGLVAYASAKLLVTIARHAQGGRLNERGKTGNRLRGQIVEALADAIRNPLSDRRLEFGPNNHLVPDVPNLCDFFYECLLKVVGYDGHQVKKNQRRNMHKRN